MDCHVGCVSRFARGVGYGHGHRVTGTATVVVGWVVIGLLAAGLGLMSANGRAGRCESRTPKPPIDDERT